MKYFLSVIPVISLLFLFLSCNENDKTEIERLNIILIMSDDMGYSDIGCYGSEIETPVLDGLAENGVRFSQFYNTARCCPTRASLLTGLYPAQTGMGFMTGDEDQPGYRGEIGNQCVTIAEVLKPAGYRTYMVANRDVSEAKPRWVPGCDHGQKSNGRFRRNISCLRTNLGKRFQHPVPNVQTLGA